jgi:hypothetical protein
MAVALSLAAVIKTCRVRALPVVTDPRLPKSHTALIETHWRWSLRKAPTFVEKKQNNKKGAQNFRNFGGRGDAGDFCEA